MIVRTVEGEASMQMKRDGFTVRSQHSGAWREDEVELVYMLRKKGCEEAVRKTRLLKVN